MIKYSLNKGDLTTMENRKDLQKQMQNYNFRRINGKIMRIINLLTPNPCTVGIVREVMADEVLEEFMNSIRYLKEIGYIKFKGQWLKDISECTFEDVKEYKLKLTFSGMDILSGFKENPSIEV